MPEKKKRLVRLRNPHQRKFIPRGPRDDREIRFCAAVAKGLSLLEAWRAAGYKPTGGDEARRKADQLVQYIDKLRDKAREVIVTKFVLDQPAILDAMVGIAFCNPQDYEEEYEVEVPDAEGEKQKVIRSRLKPLNKLTKLQAAAVDNVRDGPGGRLIYDLPALALKKSAQKDLGQHLGLFHPKLIQEHRHQHLHQHLTLKDVNMDDLRAGRDVLRKALGPRADLMLGFRPEPPEDDADEDAAQEVSAAAVERSKGQSGNVFEAEKPVRPSIKKK